MGIERDEQEERLARIEQILEQLRRQVQSFSELQREKLEDARLTVEHVAAATDASRRARRNVQAAKRTARIRVAQARNAKAR